MRVCVGGALECFHAVSHFSVDGWCRLESRPPVILNRTMTIKSTGKFSMVFSRSKPVPHHFGDWLEIQYFEKLTHFQLQHY